MVIKTFLNPKSPYLITFLTSFQKENRPKHPKSIITSYKSRGYLFSKSTTLCNRELPNERNQCSNRLLRICEDSSIATLLHSSIQEPSINYKSTKKSYSFLSNQREGTTNTNYSIKDYRRSWIPSNKPPKGFDNKEEGVQLDVTAFNGFPKKDKARKVEFVDFSRTLSNYGCFNPEQAMDTQKSWKITSNTSQPFWKKTFQNSSKKFRKFQVLKSERLCTDQGSLKVSKHGSDFEGKFRFKKFEGLFIRNRMKRSRMVTR